MAEAMEEIREARLRRFRPYPEYRDSGVKWLGKIPSCWSARAVKRIFRVTNGSTPKSGQAEYWDGDIPWATPDDLGQLTQSFIHETSRSITRGGYESCGTMMVPEGSLVLSTRAPIGHLAIAGVDLCTNQGCRSLVFRGQDSREYYYYHGLAARPVLESVGRGSTFKELAKGDLETAVLCAPPLDDQRAIASFLDRETAEIDGLVAKKERLIELLQEKRSALITRAVTRGLDPNVPMKHSGVEWLGQIPAHWEVKSLSQGLKRITYDFTNPTPVSDEGPYMLTALDIGDGEVFYENARCTTQEAFERELTDKSRPQAGDILVTKDGTLGRIAVADGTLACVNQSVAVLRFDSRAMSIDFVQNALRAAPYQDRMAFEAGGTTIKHIYISRLAKMLMALPPTTEEQRRICEFIATRRFGIERLLKRVRDGIDCLKEFRTALISAAVTGKIDVREGAA